MPDDPTPHRRDRPGIDIERAFAALPLEAPAHGAWPRLAERLVASHRPASRRRWPVAALAAAATLLLAVLPWLPRSDPHAPPAARSERPDLIALMAESARLESALPDDGGLPLSAAVAMFGLDIEDRLQALDAQLAQPVEDPTEHARLWRHRIALLHDLNRIQQARLELASQGRTFDAALVVAY